MKRRWLAAMVLWVAPLCLSCAEPGASDYVITDRGLNHRVWRKETVVETAAGLETNVSSYVELATGLNLRQPDGSFIAADPSFVITANGAEARNTLHGLVLAPDINVEGAVSVTTADGVVLRSVPTGGSTRKRLAVPISEAHRLAPYRTLTSLESPTQIILPYTSDCGPQAIALLRVRGLLASQATFRQLAIR